MNLLLTTFKVSSVKAALAKFFGKERLSSIIVSTTKNLQVLQAHIVQMPEVLCLHN